MRAVSAVLVASVVCAAVPKPNWPSSFFAKFSEQNGNLTGSGYYALDLKFNGTGAQAIYRSDGTNNRCGLFHKDTPCLELAVGGQRYFAFPSLGKCCTCCSWANGCGPVGQKWVQGAAYEGEKVIGGEACDAFSIQGFQQNVLAQTKDGSKLCELDNGPLDRMTFDLSSFTQAPDPSLFALPAGGCATPCGGDAFPCNQKPPLGAFLL